MMDRFVQTCKRLRDFLRRLFWDGPLLLESLLLLVAVRAGLRLLPLERLTGLLAGLTKTAIARRLPRPGGASRVLWAVRTACRRFPGLDTCLVRSLSTQFMLLRRDCPTELRIGVILEGGSLRAHAWLETDGRTLGESEVVTLRYASLYPARREQAASRHQAFDSAARESPGSRP